MGFFKEVRESIYSPSFYRALQDKPFSYTVKYFLKLVAVVALVYTAVIALGIAPYTKTTIREVSTFMRSSFPDNFVFEVKDGVASSTVKSPLSVKWPGEKNSFFIMNLNETKPPQVSAGSVLFLLKNSVVLVDSSDPTSIRIEEHSYGTSSDFVIAKNDIDALSEKISSLSTYFVPALIPIIYILIFVGGMWRFGYMLLAAFLVMFVAWVRGVSLSYKEAYMAGMHLLTLPLIVEAIKLVVYPVPVPYLATVIVVILTVLNFKKVQSELPLS